MDNDVVSYNTEHVNVPQAQELTSIASLILQLGSQIDNKKAELSQRRPHRAPNIWVRRKISRVVTSPRQLFPKFVMGVCSKFQLILRMCLQNWKLVALPVTEIIGCTPKILAVPGYANDPLSPKF